MATARRQAMQSAAAAQRLARVAKNSPVEAARQAYLMGRTIEGSLCARDWGDVPAGSGNPPRGALDSPGVAPGKLTSYFETHQQGRGFLKFRHYFEIYERHFAKFIGKPVNVMEIGVYSGGSLEMWHSYFGADCHVFGVDIDPRCKQYEDSKTTILIGDQSDRDFWARFRSSAPPIDILIDDGGHRAHQQIATLEEMLPYMPAGGVYLCEDMGGINNEFAGYVNGLSIRLNDQHDAPTESDAVHRVVPSPFQASIASIHRYPFVVVIEKASQRLDDFAAVRRGSQWHVSVPSLGPPERTEPQSASIQ